jgi:two-component system CheB/CheR fusion protein
MARGRRTKEKPGRSAKRITGSGLTPTPRVPPPSAKQAKSRDEGDAGHSFPVVGVGASAGGLEAFTALLRGIPGDTPIAVLLVQHLARGHDSLLPDLLKQITALTVIQARDGLRIRPGHVYVIPPDTRMTVTDGHLAVRPRGNGGGPDLPIDLLLRSMADHYRDKAIGVILSGGAHDGAQGIREIKASGGITLAQEPGEAGMDSMPRAAVATGAVDLVLPVARIAEELVRLAQHPFLTNGAPPAPVEAPKESDHLRRLFHLLRRASGVDFSDYKSPTLIRRIQRRMALHRVSSMDAYLARLEEAPAEVESLYEDILIHVTSFFREPESFEVLKEQIFPAILQSHKGGTPIRLWVPGCSSGEEVYSLAMALHERLGERADATAVQIFGTDVSQKMIDRARSGFYPESIVADVAPDRLRRFFVKVDGGYRISKVIRERCVFARQDLTRDPPFSRLHLVVCRNLLIYLGPTLQRKVLEVFHYALRPSGYLMLGRSETTGGQATLFSLIEKRFKIYRKKPGSELAEMDFQTPAVEVSPVPALPRRKPEPGPPSPGGPDVQAEANRLILDRYGPPGVIVDSGMRIVRTRGRTSPFLELPAGDASLDVLKMARQGLLYGLRHAVDESRRRGTPVRKEGLRVSGDGDLGLVDLEVTPMGPDGNRHYLVLFEQANGRGGRKKAGKNGAPAKGRKGQGEQRRAASERLTQQLQEELEASRQYLQSIIHDLEAANEELQSANEEILSSNEELQSTNEELDTAKEELQSTNEELSTLNEELHGRNDELSRVNSDLVNLLASVHIPIVIVTSDLKISRFTPAAEKLLNLIAADVGRPIGHLRPNINCPDLESLIADVIDTVTIREREVEDRDGVSYTLKVRPYKNVENRIDGAVLTLSDSATASRHAAELRVAREAAEAIISMVRDPMLFLGADLRVQKANAAFLQKFQVTAADTEGKYLQDLGSRQWDITALREILVTLLDRRSFDDFSVDAEFPALGRTRLKLDGRRLDVSRSDGSAIVLVIRDDAPHAG